MRGQKVQVAPICSTQKRLNTDMFSVALEEPESWMNIHGRLINCAASSIVPL